MLGQVRVRRGFAVLGFSGKGTDDPKLLVVRAGLCASVYQAPLWWVTRGQTPL